MAGSATHIILNPAAANGRGARHGGALIEALRARGCDAALHETQAAGDAVDIARNLAQLGADVIVAAGGDGTIHDVANGIITSGTTTALGIIPIGTGNDFAKVVPGARTVEGALAAIANGRTRQFDAGRATWQTGDEFFVNAMGTGIDVEVVRQIQALPGWPGPIKYLGGLLRALAVYEPIALRALGDGEVIERTVMMMAVGNGICQGGGFYLTPRARPSDGRLDLCVIDSLPLWKVPPVLTRVLRGRHEGNAAVTMRSVERVRFEAKGGTSLYFQLDGELREPRDTAWIDVTVQRNALNVIVSMDDKA